MNLQYAASRLLAQRLVDFVTAAEGQLQERTLADEHRDPRIDLRPL